MRRGCPVPPPTPPAPPPSPPQPRHPPNFGAGMCRAVRLWSSGSRRCWRRFWGREGSAGREMLGRPPPLAGVGVRGVAAWFPCSPPLVRPSVRAGVVPALPWGHVLSDGSARCVCWRAGIWSRGTFPRHVWMPRVLGPPSPGGFCMWRGRGDMCPGCLLGSGVHPDGLTAAGERFGFARGTGIARGGASPRTRAPIFTPCRKRWLESCVVVIFLSK